jgi:uncharacterized protein (DUF885 family)
MGVTTTRTQSSATHPAALPALPAHKSTRRSNAVDLRDKNRDFPAYSSSMRPTRRSFLHTSALTAFGAVATRTAQAKESPSATSPSAVLPKETPDNAGAFDTSTSPLRPFYDRFQSDRELLGRYYPVDWAPDTRAAMQRFYSEWQTQLATIPFVQLQQDARIDHILLRYHLQHALALLTEQETFQQQVAPFLPFAAPVLSLENARRNLQPIDAKASAAALSQIAKDIDQIQAQVSEAYKAPSVTGPFGNKEAANRAAQQLLDLRKTLQTWFTFYDGYSPDFTWWAEVSYKAADHALGQYHSTLTTQVLGLTPPAAAPAKGADSTAEESDDTFTASFASAHAGNNKDIIGHAIGEAGLQAELANAMIPYTPEQLITLANREFAWCDEQMRKASAELGFGDNWHAALEKVKNDYVAPGDQPALVVKLLTEAEAFIDAHDLITIPPIVRTTWRRRMIPPQQQLVSPFFLGGEVMQIAYPSNTMTYDQRITAMRANNINMSRATVFHELIPGHELQLFMAERFRTYRSALGSTPFLVEGWALYWEMLLWDLGFDRTPEQRIGALEWRMHRCARIIFSLSFHLGRMTPQQCIDLLIQRVGFEPEAAAGEVRRSFGGAYTPLYQAGYLLGGLQLRALHKELVPTRMTNRAFYDAVLRENEIPIEMIRASLTNQPLTADFQTQWRFYGDL